MAILHRSEVRPELGGVDVGRAAGGDRARRGGSADARASQRATASSPTCRTSPRRWRAFWRARRSARCGPRRRPSSARAASSTASRRWSPRSCWRSTATGTGARTSTGARSWSGSPSEIPGLGHTVRFGYLDGSGWEDGFLGSEDARSGVRGAAVRPPAVGALQLGNDRAAQADRPRAGRDPDRAAQEDAPAPRRPGRRSRVLVLDDRLDDVELPRRGAVDRRRDRAVRRQPRPSVARCAVGSGRRVRG